MTTDDPFEQFDRLIEKGDLIAVRELMASGVDADIRIGLGGRR